MEKTAVEFIVKELIKLGYLHSSDYSQSPNVTKVIEQAKEMEKQQMIDFYCHTNPDDVILKEFTEKRYNKTFNK